MTNPDVVFTALFGGYESLNELMIEKKPDTKYICFTDDPNLKSQSWEIRVIEPTRLESSARSSRAIKMLGHRFFPDGTRSLYIDNTVRLKVDGALVLDSWLKSSQVAFMSHYSRKSVRGEFFICSAYGLDEQKKLWTQFQTYKHAFPDVLNQKPYWGGMIARVNSPQADHFMAVWDEQFRLHSKRDQLSINVSSLISGVSINRVSAQNDESEWHIWPIASMRNLSGRDTTSLAKFRKIKIIQNGLRFGLRFYLSKFFN
jgi:hypothetical protein